MNPRTRRGVVMLLLGMICHSLAQAQLPQLKINEKEDPQVFLSHLSIDVQIAGNIAITTMEMTFRNQYNQILEGELIFPLPEGVSVSRYALDINGRLREAVPVEKEKATQVFEEIERRRVDPGLLEKVDGNNFRTRIYPLPANGTRTVLIAYEQELLSNDKRQLRYHLPLDHDKAVDHFKLNLSVLQSTLRPELEEEPDGDLQFKGWNNNYTASLSKEHFTPAHSLTLTIPKSPETAEVMMQQTGDNYYFFVNCFPPKGSRPKAKVEELTVIWDVSLSGLNRDLKKELQLLGRYLEHNGNALVHLYLLNNTFRKAGSYRVQKDNWSELKKAIEQLQYDGGTNYSRLQFPGSEEYLFFTDGLSSLNNQEIQLPGKPVYTITSAARSDFASLQYIARKTGGVFINLEALKTAEAEKLLLQQPLQFLGIKANPLVSETYPSLPQPIVGNCSVAGMVTAPQGTLTLQFGYGNTVTAEKTITLDHQQQPAGNLNLARVWAQKKIGELDIQYEQNKELISYLGKQFSIVTRNTSLIVLETVQDYVRYDIEPPAELRDAYNHLIKQQLVQRENNRQVTLSNALQHLNNLVAWWNRNFVAAVNPIKKNEVTLSQDDSRAGDLIQGTITDEQGRGIPGVSITFQNVTGTGTTTDQSGRFRIRKPAGTRTLEIAAVGYRTERVNLDHNNQVAVRLKASDQHLEEVVVVGYGTQRRRDVTGSVSQVAADKMLAAPATSQQDFSAALQGRVAGVSVDSRAKRNALRNDNAIARNMTKDDRSTSVPDNVTDPGLPASTIEVKQWTPERTYLQALEKEKAGNRYTAYLALRKDYLSTPTFYYDVANFFLRERDTLTGLQILTNMAEVDLENHELYKLLGYKLKEAGAYEEALAIFRKILQWRPHEPHSYRDYGLALADAGRYQQALDTLYTALQINYSQGVAGMYPGIEEIIVTEINQLISRYQQQLNLARIDPKLVHDLPTDVRVVLNWNKNDTDMDLWVTDPNQETCYYGHKTSLAGGRISNDFTRGYGPEQFLLKKALPGKYKVRVSYYGDQQFKFSGPTTVLAEIYTYYASGHQERKLITLQMDKGSRQEGILVGEFEFATLKK